MRRIIDEDTLHVEQEYFLNSVAGTALKKACDFTSQHETTIKGEANTFWNLFEFGRCFREDFSGPIKCLHNEDEDLNEYMKDPEAQSKQGVPTVTFSGILNGPLTFTPV
mmetsp:Transcript_29604/g.72142  ORF Transcript_29604/g.72142 Transcript_29604/m.72142 type:complete len:109 (+) Transcript_29604:739-1065(+)